MSYAALENNDLLDVNQLDDFCKEVADYQFTKHYITFNNGKIVLNSKKGLFSRFKSEDVPATAIKIFEFLESQQELFGKNIDCDMAVQRFIYLFSQTKELTEVAKKRLEQINYSILFNTQLKANEQAKRILLESNHRQREQEASLEGLKKELDDLAAVKEKLLFEQALIQKKIDDLDKTVKEQNTLILCAEGKVFPCSLELLQSKNSFLVRKIEKTNEVLEENQKYLYQADLSELSLELVGLIYQVITAENLDPLSVDLSIDAYHYFKQNADYLCAAKIGVVIFSKFPLIQILHKINSVPFKDDPITRTMIRLASKIFDVFYKLESFRQMSHMLFIEVLSHPSFKSSSEDSVLEALAIWLQNQSNDPAEQKALLHSTPLKNKKSLWDYVQPQLCSKEALYLLSDLVDLHQVDFNAKDIPVTWSNCRPPTITATGRNTYRIIWDLQRDAEENMRMPKNLYSLFKVKDRNYSLITNGFNTNHVSFGLHAEGIFNYYFGIKQFSLVTKRINWEMTDPVIYETDVKKKRFFNVFRLSKESFDLSDEKLEELQSLWSKTKTIVLDVEEMN